MRLRVLTHREAAMADALTDALVAPTAPLPAVRDTDAVEAFDAALARAPWANRVALRALLHAADLAPLVLGERRRLRRLPRARRGVVVARLEASPAGVVLKAVRGLLQLSYYGDLRVLRLLGYDPDATLRRAHGGAP